MAATVNLPVATKLPPAADKVSTEQGPTSSADRGAFSRALNEQMGKKQSSDAPEPKPASIAEKKQSVKEKSGEPAKASSEPAVDDKQDVQDTQVAQDSQDVKVEQAGVDGSIAASMQMPIMQQQPLRELIALSLQAGAQQGQTDGKVLPQVANLDQLPGVKLAEMMKMAGLDPTVEGKQGSPVLGENAGEVVLPPGLLLLQQRIQQQLATTQGQGLTSGDDVTVSADVAQLQGLERTLQALTKAAELGDSKGLEAAREQLLNRLQQVQATNGGQTDPETSDRSSQLKSFMQDLMAQQGLKMDESGKMTRVAFQDMMGKLAPQLQGQNLPSTAAVNPSALMHTGMGMISGGSETSTSSMQFSLPTTNVNVPVNNQAWGQAIGERLQWMVKQEMQEAEIRLNPRHLGPIEVKISMNQDQATVTFAAHHVMTRDALETAVPRLREMFGDSGLNLVDVNVSHNSDQRGQQANSEGGEQRQNSGNSWSPVDVMANDSSLTEIRTHNWIGSNRMLDTYV